MSHNEYPPGFAAGIAALTAAAHDRKPRVDHGLPTDPAALWKLMEAEDRAPQRPDLFDRLTEQYGFSEGSALYQRAGEWAEARAAEAGHAELTAAIATALDAAAEGDVGRLVATLTEAASAAKGLKGLWTIEYAVTWDEVITGLESAASRASEITADQKAVWRFGADLTAIGDTVRTLIE